MLFAFDETHAYYANELNGVLENDGFKTTYTVKEGKISIANINDMSLVVEGGAVVLNPQNGPTLKMSKVSKPTFDEIKAVCHQ